MTSKKEITCIICPIGCKILVDTDGTKYKALNGYKCKKGVTYSIHEAIDPRRMLTTSVLVQQGERPLVSVKSSQPIPKEKLNLVLIKIKETTIKAPIKSGQILIRNVANTGINIIATKTIEPC